MGDGSMETGPNASGHRLAGRLSHSGGLGSKPLSMTVWVVTLLLCGLGIVVGGVASDSFKWSGGSLSIALRIILWLLCFVTLQLMVLSIVKVINRPGRYVIPSPGVLVLGFLMLLVAGSVALVRALGDVTLPYDWPWVEMIIAGMSWLIAGLIGVATSHKAERLAGMARDEHLGLD